MQTKRAHCQDELLIAPPLGALILAFPDSIWECRRRQVGAWRSSRANRSPHLRPSASSAGNLFCN